jgi:hypothetical protein
MDLHVNLVQPPSWPATWPAVNVKCGSCPSLPPLPSSQAHDVSLSPIFSLSSLSPLPVLLSSPSGRKSHEIGQRVPWFPLPHLLPPIPLPYLAHLVLPFGSVAPLQRPPPSSCLCLVSPWRMDPVRGEGEGEVEG